MIMKIFLLNKKVYSFGQKAMNSDNTALKNFVKQCMLMQVG